LDDNSLLFGTLWRRIHDSREYDPLQLEGTGCPVDESLTYINMSEEKE